MIAAAAAALRDRALLLDGCYCARLTVFASAVGAAAAVGTVLRFITLYHEKQ
jgi:hypothetical protein